MKNQKEKETLEDLSDFNLVVPARDLFDAISVSADAYSRKPMSEEKMRSMKLVLGFFNAYVKAFHTKAGYFKLVGMSGKIKAYKKTVKKTK